jgi:hypothetical protein
MRPAALVLALVLATAAYAAEEASVRVREVLDNEIQTFSAAGDSHSEPAYTPASPTQLAESLEAIYSNACELLARQAFLSGRTYVQQVSDLLALRTAEGSSATSLSEQLSLAHTVLKHAQPFAEADPLLLVLVRRALLARLMRTALAEQELTMEDNASFLDLLLVVSLPMSSPVSSMPYD